jgi:Response regulator containing CheY-like receiver, AAA-type ATPase, and DNA-binding domains
MANILVVDDSNDILDVMQYVLEMEGYEVRSVMGRKDLMDELKNFTPDLIILDILLSGDNGREICKAIRANEATKHVPVLLMSASPKLLKNYEECGATDAISKPFHLPELTDKVRSALQMLPLFLINFPGVSFIHHL